MKAAKGADYALADFPHVDIADLWIGVLFEAIQKRAQSTQRDRVEVIAYRPTVAVGSWIGVSGQLVGMRPSALVARGQGHDDARFVQIARRAYDDPRVLPHELWRIGVMRKIDPIDLLEAGTTEDQALPSADPHPTG